MPATNTVRIKAKHRIGDKVSMSEDALQNYGEKFRGESFRISHVSTAYMPAEEFFRRGKPDGYHPGFDPSAGWALYDCAELPFSLYEWEIE